MSLGALGAVLDVTLDVEPTYEVAQHVFEHPTWDAILADFDEVTGDRHQREHLLDLAAHRRRGPDLGQAASARGATRPRGNRCSSDSAPSRPTSKRHPILGVDPIACTEQLGVAGPWFERLAHFKLEFTPSAGAEIQTEYLVPRADAVAAIQAVRTLAGQIAPLLLVNEIRTVRAGRPVAELVERDGCRRHPLHLEAGGGGGPRAAADDRGGAAGDRPPALGQGLHARRRRDALAVPAVG